MKKYLYICLLVLAAFGMTGCISNVEECHYHCKTTYLEVRSDDWKFDDTNQQFYAHFDRPEITSTIYDYGNYSLHREYNTGTKDAYQVGLPQTILLYEDVETAEDTQTVYYSQVVDYRIGVGYVEIQVTNSDFFYPKDNTGKLIKPEYMLFHLQIIY